MVFRYQGGVFSCWELHACNPVLNRHYCIQRILRVCFGHFKNRSGHRMCIEFLDSFISLTSLNRSIISIIKWNARVFIIYRALSVSLSLSHTVIMPPDSHKTTLTSSAPLSLDRSSKVVPSISRLRQRQPPVSVWVWLVVLPICKWDCWASTKAETIPPLTAHRWSQLPCLASVPAAALQFCADRIWTGCGDFVYCTHSSSSFPYISRCPLDSRGLLLPLPQKPSFYSLSLTLLCSAYLESFNFFSLSSSFLHYLVYTLKLPLSFSLFFVIPDRDL